MPVQLKQGKLQPEHCEPSTKVWAGQVSMHCSLYRRRPTGQDVQRVVVTEHVAQLGSQVAHEWMSAWTDPAGHVG